MPTCIECKPKLVIVPSARGLVVHLQRCHKFTTLSTYKCGERGCQRKFTCTKAFVKHVSRCAKDEYTCETIQEPESLNCNPIENVSVSGDVDSNANCDSMNDDLESFAASDLESFLAHQADAFVCKYYSKPSFPRNIVQDIINDTDDFLNNGSAMHLLKDKVMDALNTSQAEPCVIEEISSMFALIQNPFHHLRTEHLRLKHFTSSGCYVVPENFILGRRLLPIRTKKGVLYKWRPVYAVHIPLGGVLKNFLELPNMLQNILEYVDILMKDEENLCNFIQGNLWKMKRRKFKSSDIVLPLHVYFDDFQANNNLGPHSLKIGGVYVIIACLPPEIASRLENIFLAILFYSGDLEVFTAKKILEPLLKVLQTLEQEGIDVMIPSRGKVKVYFVMGLLLGDNLAVHQLCGFVCGFAWANFPCRFCKVPQERMRYDYQLDRTLLRDKVNYKEDVLTADQAQTGIRENCSLNSLESFDITENQEGDILHDFDESILHKIIIFILGHFTKSGKKEKPLFTLRILNRRIMFFKFGTYSALHKTRLCITAEELDKGKLKMTGSEMQCFFRSFGVLMGDLVPESNVFWKLYLCLQRVLDLVLCKRLTKGSITSLRFHLRELARQYLCHDGNHLTFKFHKILWHYCDIIEHSGPVANLTTRRFESKHRQLKLGLYTNMSRVHACWSIAVKHQLGLCHRFVAGKSLPEIEMGSGRVFSPNDMKVFHNILGTLKTTFLDLNSVFMPNWVEYKGSRFDSESILVIDIDDNFGWPIFGELKGIFVLGETIAVLCHKFETLGFFEHYYAYEVKRTRQEVCLNIANLADPLPLNVLRDRRGGLFVVMRYAL